LGGELPLREAEVMDVDEAFGLEGFCRIVWLLLAPYEPF
jgi:hypothetical protein